MRFLIAALFWLAAVALAPRAIAGWFVSPGVKWASFAARPEDSEPTPNYYGYGGELALGYSAKQMLDIGGYGSYVPGKRKEAAFGRDDASLVSYGGEIACRFADAVYVGLRGGASTYHLYKAIDDSEIWGEWHGPSGGLSLGAVAKLSRQSYMQTTFDVMHHVLKPIDAEFGTERRRFDSFSISLAYMFNSYDSYLIENTIFKDFLDSMIFF